MTTHYHRVASALDQEIGFNVACIGMSEEEAIKAAKDRWFYNDLYFRAMCRICDREGHKIQDNGYGGPDSGCVHLDCLRCGWSHHVTLY